MMILEKIENIYYDIVEKLEDIEYYLYHYFFIKEIVKRNIIIISRVNIITLQEFETIDNIRKLEELEIILSNYSFDKVNRLYNKPVATLSSPIFNRFIKQRIDKIIKFEELKSWILHYYNPNIHNDYIKQFLEIITEDIFNNNYNISLSYYLEKVGILKL
jgi:hypothetical protein